MTVLQGVLLLVLAYGLTLAGVVLGLTYIFNHSKDWLDRL